MPKFFYDMLNITYSLFSKTYYNVLASKVLPFLSLILCISLGGCSHDNDGDVTDNLVGVWNVTEVQAVGVVSGISISQEATPSGTITFNTDFTGEENYQFEFSGMVFSESDKFTWVSDANTIVFDPTTAIETRWTRIINEADRQRATSPFQIGTDEVEITVTITK